MGYFNRIEVADMASFITTRTRNSELWFINNKALDEEILSFGAKYSTRYNAQLFALGIEGSHKHMVAMFPECNRASFMRDFNSTTAKAVKSFVKEYPGGGLWGRRYSAEFLPEAKDIENKFFYTVLQPVHDGLVEYIHQYQGYNCYHDATRGIKRKFTVVRRAEYNAARRYNDDVDILDYTDTFYLEYQRLPGYEHLSQAEYAEVMDKKLEEYRLAAIEERRAAGLTGFVGAERLLQIVPGTPALNPKKSTRNSFRPRVICHKRERQDEVLSWMFNKLNEHKDASRRRRAGEKDVVYPDGMYPPYGGLTAPARYY